MECKEAQVFVSVLYDGVRVPAGAAEHIKACVECQRGLGDYARIGTELRLAASADDEAAPNPLWAAPPPRSLGVRWANAWRGRVAIPRFALALSLLIIAGLSAGLGLVWANGNGEGFRCEMYVLDSSSRFGAWLPPGRSSEMKDGGSPAGFVVAEFKLLNLHDGVARLDVQARRFDKPPSFSTKQETFAAVPHQTFEYSPGQTLDIPIEGGGTIRLTGTIGKFKKETAAPTEVDPDAISLSDPVLIRDGKQVIQVTDNAVVSAPGERAAVAVYVPGEGRYIFGHSWFEGAVAAEAYYGQARFRLDGKDYLLSSATRLTGGAQPRQIWVYRDAAFKPGPWEALQQGGKDVPIIASTADVSNFLRK